MLAQRVVRKRSKKEAERIARQESRRITQQIGESFPKRIRPPQEPPMRRPDVVGGRDLPGEALERATGARAIERQIGRDFPKRIRPPVVQVVMERASGQ